MHPPSRAQAAHPFPGPAVSVILPTFNRAEILLRTLRALDGQTRPPAEVIAVDDGSTDATPDVLREWAAARHPFRATALQQPNRGPAAARNRGMAEARGEWLVFLGDDTVPEPDLIEAHLRRQATLPAPAALVGHTGWDPETVRVTPFLAFINEEGPQFKYAHMDPAGPNSFTCFYSSNLSLPRDVPGGLRFDEAFPVAGWEDTELGYRLHREGIPLYYEPGARARHAHAVTLTSFARRTERLGAVARILLARHPELRAQIRLPGPRALPLLRCGTAPLIRLLPLLQGADRRGLPLPGALYRALLGAFYLRGFRRQSN